MEWLYSRCFLPSFGAQTNGSGAGLERSCSAAGKQLRDGAGWAGETGLSPARQAQPAAPAAALGTGDICTGLQRVQQVMRGDSGAGHAPGSTGHHHTGHVPTPAGTCIEHQHSLLLFTTHPTFIIGLFLIRKWGCLSFFLVSLLHINAWTGSFLSKFREARFCIYFSPGGAGEKRTGGLCGFSLCCKHALPREPSINSPHFLNRNTLQPSLGRMQSLRRKNLLLGASLFQSSSANSGVVCGREQLEVHTHTDTVATLLLQHSE